MFFCTGVDRKKCSVWLANISYIMTISVLQHAEKVLMSARNGSHRRRIVRVWDKTRWRTVRNVIGAWAGEVQKYSFMQGENLLTENLREMLTIKIRIIIMV